MRKCLITVVKKINKSLASLSSGEGTRERPI
jgi:hypothetical protein